MNNIAHFHLVITHLPVILPFISFLILLFGIVLRSEDFKRLAYAFLIFSAFSALLSVYTGEGAEHIVEKLGRDHKFIHEHEERAEFFALCSYILGLIGAIALYLNWKNKPLKNIAMIVVMVSTLIVMYLAKGTGTSGAKISHPEVYDKQLKGKKIKVKL
ncbi:MAG: hypothetical protein RL264_1635 [Bacteroidota bacterium]|jgi:disulfide bond formation protein DsbB